MVIAVPGPKNDDQPEKSQGPKPSRRWETFIVLGSGAALFIGLLLAKAFS